MLKTFFNKYGPALYHNLVGKNVVGFSLSSRIMKSGRKILQEVKKLDAETMSPNLGFDFFSMVKH